MKIIVTGKNISVTEKINDEIEKRLEKLGKFFADDIQANVVIHPERAKVKMETTIITKGTIFRAEDVSQDVYDCIDNVAEKLTKQITKYKDKLITKHQSKESLRFEFIPDPDEAEEKVESKVVKSKSFQIFPMTPDEAALQMEMVGHNFFVFVNDRTGEVNVIYKRNDADYGLLETFK